MRLKLGLFCSLAVLLAPGCADPREKLTPPRTLIAPAYSGSEPIIAIAPPANESGTTLVDPLMVADQLAGQVERVDGLRAMPLNRTLTAMRALKMDAVNSPQDARRLAEALDADGIIVGTITAYDPYNPPKFGLSLALFPAPGRMTPPAAAPAPPDNPGSGLVDPVTLQTSPTDAWAPVGEGSDTLPSVASANLNAADHGVQALVKSYAEGRSETVSALGWRRYLASMRLFTDFACYHLMDDLLASESRRVAPAPVATAERQPAASARNLE